ncbi:RelA/SpoT domain-containing protein [Botrimarina sp.]|uniref:RelA/SpoT domain-containing protein n=1 Tax=Botrimarina sp. TaxID=2795802 RepID=UPI0032ECCE7F
MEWPTPRYSRNSVNRAGRLLAFGPRGDASAISEALDALANWRACHGYPINTFQATLRSKLTRLSCDYLVVQRLKRTPSILEKLRRYPSMKLARMQDIGGLRAVVETVDHAERLRADYRESRFAHELVADTDYIAEPKASGYRGFHLVYKYCGRKTAAYDGLQVELQIRTRIQHAWATAVEVAGTFLNQSLKSSEGPGEWLDFFELASAGLASLEGSPLPRRFLKYSVPQLKSMIRTEEERLSISEKLGAFRIAFNAISEDPHRGSYFLIVLDPELKEVSVTTYAKSRLEEASRDYAYTEREISEGTASQAVLVAATSIEQLRRAYPNYFLDTRDFLDLLSRFSLGRGIAI